MCLTCGCALRDPSLADDSHGDSRQITMSDLMAAAEANSTSPAEATAMLGASLQVAMPEPEDVTKQGKPDQFCLGVAYAPGRLPEIAKGQDGGRDFFSPRELERACWSFMLNGQQQGLFHVDGTEGAARPVENSIYRNPVPWVVPAPNGGPPVIVRKGTWLLGSLMDDRAWRLALEGKANGWSMQGEAKRRRVA